MFFIYPRYESFVRCCANSFSQFVACLFIFNSEIPMENCLTFLKSDLLKFFFLLWMILLVSGLKTFHQAMIHYFLCFFPLNFKIILYLHLNLWLGSLLYEVWGLHRFLFSYRFPVAPTAFLEKTILLPLNNFCTFVKIQLDIFVGIYLWDVMSVLLICLPSSLPISHHLSYSSYITLPSIRIILSTLVFFSKTILEILDPVSYLTNFRISF